MSNFWCVDPATNAEEVTLEYGGREFRIFLKRELNVSEQRAIDTAGFRSLTGLNNSRDRQSDGPEIAIDWKAQSFARTTTYLVDWTLTDDHGNKLPLSMVKTLRTPVYEVIETAITAHIEKMEAMRKNSTGGSAPQAMSA